MKRRTFLRILGLAPVAAALPAMALPRPDNVKDTVKGSVTMGDQSGLDTGIYLMQTSEDVTRMVIQADRFGV